MKSILGSLLVITSLNAFAGGGFKYNSPVPEDLQEKIMEALGNQCPKISATSIQETRSRVHFDYIEEDLRDAYYNSHFSANYYVDDQNMGNAQIDVQSAKLANHTHGQQLQVKSVQSTGVELCH